MFIVDFLFYFVLMFVFVSLKAKDRGRGIEDTIQRWTSTLLLSLYVFGNVLAYNVERADFTPDFLCVLVPMLGMETLSMSRKVRENSVSDSDFYSFFIILGVNVYAIYRLSVRCF